MTEPSINRNLDDLDPKFRVILETVLQDCKDAGQPFKFHEGFRTKARQQWLFGQGRPGVLPYGRPGNRVTQKNGINNLSNHQGTGHAGTGRAADCYPLDEHGKVVLEPPDRVWETFAKIAEKHGLVAGYRWHEPHDPPHIELK